MVWTCDKEFWKEEIRQDHGHKERDANCCFFLFKQHRYAFTFQKTDSTFNANVF